MSEEMNDARHHLPRAACYRACRRRGFTLIEAALATVIIGLGVVAMMQLLAAGTISNVAGTKLTTASNLANSINEWSLRVGYGQLRSTFNDKSFDPPKDARGTNLTGFGGWKQVVDVHYVNPDRITVAVADAQEEPTSRITVSVQHNGETVHTASWVVTANQWPLPPPPP